MAFGIGIEGSLVKRFVVSCMATAALLAAVAGPAAAAQRPFAASSIWNWRPPADAPLDPNADALVAELRRQELATTSWINPASNSSPIYVATASQSPSYVRLDVPNAPALQEAFAAVPIPRGARPASGG